MKRIALVDIKVNDCIGAKNPYHYRNKIQMPYQKDRKGNIVMGSINRIHMRLFQRKNA